MDDLPFDFALIDDGNPESDHDQRRHHENCINHQGALHQVHYLFPNVLSERMKVAIDLIFQNLSAEKSTQTSQGRRIFVEAPEIEV